MLWRKVCDTHTWGTWSHLQGQERPPQEVRSKNESEYLSKKEGKYSRQREQHEQAFPQFLHLAPLTPLAPWSNKPSSYVRVFSFSVPFAWKALPQDLRVIRLSFHLNSNCKREALSFSKALPAYKEEPVSHAFLYQLQLILSIAMNNHHYLIWVFFIFVFAFGMSFPTLECKLH